MSARRTDRSSGNGARWRRFFRVLLVLFGMTMSAGACAGAAHAAEPAGQADSAAATAISGVNLGLSSVACAPSTTTCVAVGENRVYNDSAGAYVYTGEAVVIDNGVPGSALALSGTFLPAAVACSSASQCVIGGSDANGGAILPFTLAAQTPSFGTVEDIANTTGLTGIACASGGSACVASGYDANGGGAVIDLPGGPEGTPSSAEDVSSTGTLYGISCIASQCLAIGQTTALPISLPSATLGTPQTVNGIYEVSGVSCVSGSGTVICEVVGDGDDASDNGFSAGAAVEFTGSTGVSAGVQQPVEAGTQSGDYSGDLDGVSCPSVSYCVGVGTALGSDNEGGAVAFAPSGAIGNGTNDPDSSLLTAVECQSETSCLEGGGNGGNGAELDDLPVNTATATLRGTVTLTSSASTDVSGAPVQACATDGSFCVVAGASTDTSGDYEIAVPLGYAYVVTAFSPANANDTEASSSPTAAVESDGVSGVDVSLAPPPTLATGISVTSPGYGTQSGAARVNWEAPFTVHIPASAFPSGEVTTVESLVITGTNTSTGLLQSDTVYVGGETSTGSGQTAANGLVVGVDGVDITAPSLAPIHGPVTLVLNSFSVATAPTGIAVSGAGPVQFTQGTLTRQPAIIATDFGVDHTVGTPTITGADASTFSLNSAPACQTLVQQTAANPGDDQSCSFSVTWTPPANLATPPQAYYHATLNVPVTNSSGNAAQVQIPLLGCDARVPAASTCQGGTMLGSVYVDPSGEVETTTTGGATVPLSGATVTLEQKGSSGSYSAVPTGSDVMSPENRTNPVTTEADGTFGWDTLAGTYEITASDSACANTATSAPETVPPPALGIDLLLSCPGVTQASTNTTLGAVPETVAPGQAVELTAAVAGTDPTGTITLSDGGTFVATVPVNSATAEADYATSALPPGSDTITASYSGDANNAPSEGRQTVTIESAARVATATAVVATPSASAPGTAVTYSATVTPASGAADPTGSVSFAADLGGGTTVLCTGMLSGTAATCSSGSAPAGADTIAATYSGDTNFAASSGSASETVTAPATGSAGASSTTSTPTTTSSPSSSSPPTAPSTSAPTTSTPHPTSAPTATAGTQLTGILGNQQISVTTPSEAVCLAPSAKAMVTLRSTAVKGSGKPAAKFRSAVVLLDRGVKHSRKVTLHGRTVIKITYTPNATLTRASEAASVSLKGLLAGLHTVKVIVSYSETVTTTKTAVVNGRKKTHKVRVTKLVTLTLSAKLKIC